MKKALILIFSTILFYSCNTEDPIGKWDDNIKLSKKKVEFSAQENTVTITTKGSSWWIDNIKLDDTNIMHQTNLDDPSETPYQVTEESFVLVRPDKTTLHITMSENRTGKERVLIISLQAGNYFDYITIKQSAD
jgi:hypothetical protein